MDDELRQTVLGKTKPSRIIRRLEAREVSRLPWERRVATLLRLAPAGINTVLLALRHLRAAMQLSSAAEAAVGVRLQNLPQVTLVRATHATHAAGTTLD